MADEEPEKEDGEEEEEQEEKKDHEGVRRKLMTVGFTRVSLHPADTRRAFGAF